MKLFFNIQNVCGDQIGDFDLDSIGNDPNFVFKVDLNFNPITLYGPSGEIITVNSWIECANYVNGGWSNNLIINSNSNMYYFFFLLSFTTSVFLFNFIKKKYEKNQ